MNLLAQISFHFQANNFFRIVFHFHSQLLARMQSNDIVLIFLSSFCQFAELLATAFSALIAVSELAAACLVSSCHQASASQV